MSALDLVLATFGGTVLALGLVAGIVQRSPAADPMLAVAAGVAIGPAGLGLVDPAAWAAPGEGARVVEQAARLTLAIALMGVALRLRREDIVRLARPLAWLLTAGMAAMWLVSSLVAWLAFGASAWLCLLIGAVITPTDPVVASSIVSGRFARSHLRGGLRDTLSLESGANDGLAYPFVMLAVLMLTHPPGEALARWAWEAVLVGVGLAVPIGLALGWGTARLLGLARARGLVEHHSLMTTTIALSLTVLGAAALAGADALVSVFVAGLAYNWADRRDDEGEEEDVQEAIAKLFTRPIFVLLGVLLPWEAWGERPWAFALFALGVLALRRPAAIGALAPVLRSRHAPRDLAFMGWFGPVGVAALFYAMLALRETGHALVWHAAAAAILASVAAHGATAAPLTRRHARGADPAPGED